MPAPLKRYFCILMLKISYIIPYDIIIFNVQSCFCSRKSKQLKYIERSSELEIKESTSLESGCMADLIQKMT